jgi:hypothetical protein
MTVFFGLAGRFRSKKAVYGGIGVTSTARFLSAKSSF